MSRCFPYPPPGYERARNRDDALIESIKFQREGKRAKKERRKEKKEEKTRKNGEIKNKKQSHKKRHKDERSQENQKGGDRQKRRETETEQFEKSSLTEECGHPLVGTQNLCDSSDSTLNSNKRQKHNPGGSIIRIRLPLQRHKDPEVLPPGKEQPCSALTRTTARLVSERREHPCSTSRTTDQELAIKRGKEKACLTSQASEIPADNLEATPASSLYVSGSPLLELQFRNLLGNWVPPPMQMQTETEHSDFGDQEWLFATKQNQNSLAKGPKASSLGLSCGNSTLWPHACYLPEADIYALPFAIPF